MKVAVMTMVQNETTFLPIWLAYYASQVGMDNLYIIDHGSTDGSTDMSRANIFRLPRTPLDEEVRAKSVSQMHRSLLGYYDVVMFTDADEFVIADPNKYNNLIHFLAGNDNDIISPVGLDVLHLRDIEKDMDFDRPPLTQRTVVKFSPYFCKPCIGRVAIDWHPGFHITKQGTALHPDLYLFHLKSIDFNTSLEQQANRRQSLLAKSNIDQRLSLHFLDSDYQMSEKFFSETSGSIENKLIDGFSFRDAVVRMFSEDSAFAIRDWPYARIPPRFKHVIPARPIQLK